MANASATTEIRPPISAIATGPRITATSELVVKREGSWAATTGSPGTKAANRKASAATAPGSTVTNTEGREPG